MPPNARWEDGFHPVDLSFDSCGRPVVSSDGSRVSGVYKGSKLVQIKYTRDKFEPLVTAPPRVAPAIATLGALTTSPAVVLGMLLTLLTKLLLSQA